MKRTLFLFFVLLSFTLCIAQDKKESKTQSKELFKAIKGNNIDAVKLLIAEGVNINQIYRYQTPLYYAVLKNKGEIVKILLDNGANVNNGCPDISKSESFEDGWSPLQCAAYMGRIEIVKLLLEKTPNIDVIMPLRNQTALDMAIQRNRTEIVSLIREARKNQLGNVPEREYHSFDTSAALLDLINGVSDVLDKKGNNHASGVNNVNSKIQTNASSQTKNAITNNSLNTQANKTVTQIKQHDKKQYEMYMKLYRKEQADSDSYYKEYETHGNTSDLGKSKDCQARANDYLSKANIWK